MKDLHENVPLMSMLILTYNFEQYVRATVSAALAQDYSNLEIVISDDCSKDRTWDIVQEIVSQYRTNGGMHRVVLVRNERNLGFVPNFENAKKQCHGELIIYNDGDDVSYPSRVSEVAEEWLRTNRRSWVIYSQAETIDTDGCVTGRLSEMKTKESVLGAIATYRRGMEEVFGPIVEENATQDEVYGVRALMLGPRGFVDKVLLQYRIGSGESSGFSNYRKRRIHEIRFRRLGAQRQILRDVEHVKELLGANYEFWRSESDRKLRQNLGMLDLLEGNSFRKRLEGLQKLDFKKTLGQRWLYLVLLLPHCMSDGILALGARIYDVWVCLKRKKQSTLQDGNSAKFIKKRVLQ